MDVSNINNTTRVVFNYETYSSNSTDKTDVDQGNEITLGKDYVEFSMDYSNDEVSGILNNIAESFLSSDFYLPDNRTIADSANDYGEILKSINSSIKINNETKEKLAITLEDSFNDFSDKEAKYISDGLSDFFNGAYVSKEIIEKNGVSNLGITAEELFDGDEFEKNLRNMFTAAKVFYRNNVDGTTEQMNEYLEEKFNKTESIEKLSYDDYKALEDLNKPKTANDSNESTFLNISIYGSAKRKAIEMQNSLENLKKVGTSDILINTFSKACDQNNDRNQRVEAYGKIRVSYTKNREAILKLIENNMNRLKELDDKRKELIENYKKQIQEFKKNMLKLALLKNNGLDKMLQDLEKVHFSQLENIDKQKAEIEDNQNELKKQYKDTNDSFNGFLKNPIPEINAYISKNKEELTA